MNVSMSNQPVERLTPDQVERMEAAVQALASNGLEEESGGRESGTEKSDTMTEKPKPPQPGSLAASGDRSGWLFSQIVAWSMVTLVLGTVAGVWVKLFWLGWVLKDVLQCR